jgi:hypothetical protein
MTLTDYINRDRSAESARRGRYLPDGKLNIAGRWNSPGTISFMKKLLAKNKFIIKYIIKFKELANTPCDPLRAT